VIYLGEFYRPMPEQTAKNCPGPMCLPTVLADNCLSYAQCRRPSIDTRLDIIDSEVRPSGIWFVTHGRDGFG
jgi:hypothetical protein